MVVWGLFYVIPGVVFWLAFRRPLYLINMDYVDHMRTGKHIGAGARIGGAMGKVYDSATRSLLTGAGFSGSRYL